MIAPQQNKKFKQKDFIQHRLKMDKGMELSGIFPGSTLVFGTCVGLLIPVVLASMKKSKNTEELINIKTKRLDDIAKSRINEKMNEQEELAITLALEAEKFRNEEKARIFMFKVSEFKGIKRNGPYILFYPTHHTTPNQLMRISITILLMLKNRMKKKDKMIL